MSGHGDEMVVDMEGAVVHGGVGLGYESKW